LDLQFFEVVAAEAGIAADNAHIGRLSKADLDVIVDVLKTVDSPCCQDGD
jgi:hypothetical protein